MSLEVSIDADPEWDSSTDWQRLAALAARSAIAESAYPRLGDGPRPVEISVRLTGDRQVRALNARWRGRDSATNVLSFPLADPDELADLSPGGPELMLGDIVLAHGVCDAEAAERRVPLAAHASHLLVHGTLHLLGYDHGDDDRADDMERRETRALARLGIADPYRIEG